MRQHSLAVVDKPKYVAAIVGAGPAGLFAARALANAGAAVVLFNRDIKPGGLAEYGIFFSKLKMKDGLRRQFQQILDMPSILYAGNVAIGQKGDLSLAELRALGFQAILVTAGAQGTKWLGLPGEDLLGVYHAKDIVYHYNHLPPFGQQKFRVGQKLALIGVGNVMLDLAHWAARYLKVDEIVAVARRGPAEVKFSKKEMEVVAHNLDIKALDAEIKRVTPAMQAIGQDPQAAKAFILAALPKADAPVSQTRLRFDFLASPSRIVGGERGEVRGLEVEDTLLIPHDSGEPQAKRTGTKRIIDVDTVIFCIGDRVDESLGLPVRKNEFIKHPNPRFPVDGVSFEAYNPDLGKGIDRVFVAGWSREASHGLVGVARRDGENGAEAVAHFLQSQPALLNPQGILDELEKRLDHLEKPVVCKADLPRLLEQERCEAQRLGIEEFKFDSNEAMLKAMGLA
jgi:ferredoxin/flavodoxin---NADP+ reductase